MALGAPAGPPPYSLQSVGEIPVFTLRLPLAIVLMASLAAPAAAQTAAPSGQPQGPTRRADVQKSLDDNYAKLDADKDGMLSRAEIDRAQAEAVRNAQAALAHRMEQEFAKLDTNKDGALNIAEFRAATPAPRSVSTDEFLGRFDSNKDGRVSAAEFKNPPLAAFDRLDANKDGTLTPQEQAAARQAQSQQGR
jgi:hypothetical protein